MLQPAILALHNLLCLSALAKDEYYNLLTLKLERKMQKFDLRLKSG